MGIICNLKLLPLVGFLYPHDPKTQDFIFQRTYLQFIDYKVMNYPYTHNDLGQFGES